MAYLVTGVPGFIASRLVRALAPEGKPLFLLCERRFEEKTRALAKSLEAAAAAAGVAALPVHVVPGDITEADLGIAREPLARIRAQVTEVYHLAAIYDLTVPEELARRVNVEGTKNVVELVASIAGCQLHYVSTCYVAGDRTGVVREEELERGQHFKNHYESTKFEAERVVRAAMDRVETRIFRPAVVFGDSETGETEKFDGPYFALRALCMGLLVVLPGASKARVNVVPVDFIVRALVAIPKQPNTRGKTFALADPAPLAAREFVRLAAERLGAPRPRLSIPTWLFRLPLKFAPLQRKLGIPIQTVDYFNIDVTFDTTNATAALASAGLACPRVPDYFDKILDYYRRKAELPWSFARAAAAAPS